MTARAVLDAARSRSVMITAAESCTGGMVMAALTDTPGSSAVVECGFVTYSNAAKREMLGVLEATLEAHGAVSEEVAREMAAGALSRSGAALSVSITGIAGPGGSEHKPEGRVCFGLADGKTVRSETQEFGALGRAEVRIAARDHALGLLLRALTQRA
ncbi:CinA family protein [Roseovarius sp. LXJ103]|uniref:CinA family protein n=1 Tax=Roseovarius carneus TaxID=2853164 RepID=UPI000D613982|nr:CinA family protein [Roseovarius carneus]MBZ8119399.1 CinA family protein [Roseovarius carneus]PWE34955.1 damage-inducible protein CinA [Pelagicola sp. LXJ1103]